MFERRPRAGLGALFLGLVGLSASAQTLLQTRDAESVVGTNVTTLTLAFASPVTPGSGLIAVCRTGKDQTNITVSDATTTWTQATFVNDPGNRSVAVAYLANATGGPMTINCSWGPNGTQMNELAIFEYSGLASTAMLDQQTSACPVSPSATPSSGGLALGASTGLLVGAITIDSASVTLFSSEAPGFTARSLGSYGTTNHPHLHTADRVFTSPGNYGYQPTLAVAEGACMVLAAFKAAPLDGGTAVDAGSGADAGAAADGGSPDAGQARGPFGIGCSAAGAGGPGAVLALAAAVGLRRRRRA